MRPKFCVAFVARKWAQQHCQAACAQSPLAPSAQCGGVCDVQRRASCSQGDPLGVVLSGSFLSYRCWRRSSWPSEIGKCNSSLKDWANRDNDGVIQGESTADLWKHGLALLWPVRPLAFAYVGLTFLSLVSWAFGFLPLLRRLLTWRQYMQPTSSPSGLNVDLLSVCAGGFGTKSSRRQWPVKDSVVMGGSSSSIGPHGTWLRIRHLLSVGQMAVWKAVFILSYLALIWCALRTLTKIL